MRRSTTLARFARLSLLEVRRDDKEFLVAPPHFEEGQRGEAARGGKSHGEET